MLVLSLKVETLLDFGSWLTPAGTGSSFVKSDVMLLHQQRATDRCPSCHAAASHAFCSCLQARARLREIHVSLLRKHIDRVEHIGEGVDVAREMGWGADEAAAEVRRCAG